MTIYETEQDALDAIAPNVTEVANGILKISPGYKPTKTDFEAINYLICEWDYILTI